MRRNFTIICRALLLAGIAVPAVGSASPYELSYAGRLTGADGAPVAGTVDLKLRFFDAAAAGHQLGADVNVAAAALTDGVFQAPVALDGTAYQGIFGGTGPVFIEVTDVTNAKTYPRQRFAAVPYALRVPVDGTTVTFDGSGQLTVASVPQSQVAGLGAALGAKADQSALTPALAAKADSTHTHTLAGDVSGVLGTTVVGKLRGTLVSAAAPNTIGQVLKWDGTAWGPGIDLNGTAGQAEATTASNVGVGAGLFRALSTFDLQFRSVVAGSGVSVTQNANDVTVAVTPVQSLTSVDYNANGHKVGLKAPAGLGADVTFALPAVDGAAGQVLKTDGAGALGWAAQPAVPVGSVNGKTGTVTLTTTDVTEASGLYFTAGRANGAFTAAAPLAYNGAGGYSLPGAASGTDGYLKGADWTTFNAKQDVIAKATGSMNGYLASTDWVTFNGKQATLAAAAGGSNGYLSSTDWVTFNGKGAPLPISTASANGYLSSTDWATFNNKGGGLGFTPVNKAGDTMSGALALPMGGLAVGSTQFVVASTGIGIGTTDPLNGVGYGIYQRVVAINGSGNQSPYAFGVLNLTNNAGTANTGDQLGELDFDSLHNYAAPHTSIMANLEGSGGGLGFGSNMQLYTKGDNGGQAERVRISSAGKVGIGTTNPLSNLQLGALSSLSTATPVTLSLGGTFSSTAGANSKLKLYDDGTNVIGLGLSSGLMNFNTFAGNGFAYFIAGSEKVRIDASGNLGIGTTSPAVPLAVNGKMTATGTPFSLGNESANLVASVASGATTATWTADQLVAWTTLGGTAYLGSSLSLAFNGATTGAGGMDTGALPTSNNLYVYAIYNPGSNTWAALGTTAGAGAAIYGGANMPANYTASALLWSGVTNASAQFQKFYQQGRTVYLTPQNVTSIASASKATPTSWTSFSVSAWVPANAKTVSGKCGEHTSATVPASFALAADSSATAEQGCASAASSYRVGTSLMYYAAAFGPVPMITAQTLYYEITSMANSSVSVDITGYTF